MQALRAGPYSASLTSHLPSTPSVLPPPRAPPKKISETGQATRRRCEPACASQVRGPPSCGALACAKQATWLSASALRIGVRRRDRRLPLLGCGDAVGEHMAKVHLIDLVHLDPGLSEEAEIIAERHEGEALVAEPELHLARLEPGPAV